MMNEGNNDKNVKVTIIDRTENFLGQLKYTVTVHPSFEFIAAPDEIKSDDEKHFYISQRIAEEFLKFFKVPNYYPLGAPGEPGVITQGEPISEEYLYKNKFRFQRMTKDSMWYVTYYNRIIAWGQYRHDLEEWIDTTYKI